MLTLVDVKLVTPETSKVVNLPDAGVLEPIGVLSKLLNEAVGALIESETCKLPPTPKPPITIKAPVVGLVLVAGFDTTSWLVLLITTFAPGAELRLISPMVVDIVLVTNLKVLLPTFEYSSVKLLLIFWKANLIGSPVESLGLTPTLIICCVINISCLIFISTGDRC